MPDNVVKKAINALPVGIFSNPGKNIQPVYTRVYDEYLEREIVKHTSDTDIYELIQESDNTSDISLLKKMINGGQVEAPTDPMAQYGLDLANMPKDIHQLYDRVNSQDAAFKSLPEYMQKGFGNSDAMRAALLDGSYYVKVEQMASAQAQAAAKAAVEAAKQEKGE